jgi:hypothetical protein
MGFDIKTDRLTDRQLKYYFDFEDSRSWEAVSQEHEAIMERGWEFSSVRAGMKRRLNVQYLECIVQWRHCKGVAIVEICYPATTSVSRR